MVFRSFLTLLLGGLILGTSAAEVLKALPVDPSEITPELNAALAAEPLDDVAAKPLPAGEIELEPLKPNPASDSPVLATPPSREDAVRLQIFLDESHFGPGVIDGKPGRFTILAVDSWNEVNGHPAGVIEPAMAAARSAVSNPFATAIVPAAARKWVDSSLSYKRSQQANAKRMSYRSYAEFMSERYHTDVEFLAELNGWTKTNAAQPGNALIVPNVKPFLVELINGARYETDELLASRYVVIDTAINQLRIFENQPKALPVGADGSLQVTANRALLASFPITPGQERFIKYGAWELKNAVELPVWRYDQSLLDGKGRSSNALNIPPGPNSPVGVIWMGLSVSGIGMHGTSDPETIGRARSAGCIRLANWDAMRLPGYVRPGAGVEIR